jgi:ethanolaminephosphotransferase
LDAVLNIHQAGDQAAILERTDSWLRQLIFSSEHQVEAATPGAHPARRKARFYGDDTWLRLFPASWFTEVDGVSSFYVSVSPPSQFFLTPRNKQTRGPTHY